MKKDSPEVAMQLSELITQMLKYENRITAEEALSHPVFKMNPLFFSKTR